MAEYNPSKIIKDGNTYNFRDTTKIPLAGSNKISGSLIPSIDGTVDLGSLSYQWNNAYIKSLTINGVVCGDILTHNVSEFAQTGHTHSISDITDLPSVLPVGSYIQFAGSQAPEGFLVCNGGEISRTTYSALFAVIGTTYGSGDGSTTFNLPDLTDRFLQGSTTSGTVKNAGLPGITGSVALHGSGTSTNLAGTSGSFAGFGVRSKYQVGTYVGDATSYDGFDFSASRSSSIYGNSSTVQPPALTCLICIKY